MDRNFFALSLGLAGMALLPSLARATPTPCSAHDAVAAKPARPVSEQPHAIRLPEHATLMGLCAPDKRKWWLTITLPSGTTCRVAMGDTFESRAPTQVAKGDPA